MSSSSAAASCHIPFDIIPEILLLLPVKSILRFRSVSKPWCNLIGGPDFIKKYQCHSIKSNNWKMIIKDSHRMLSVDLSMLEDQNIADVIRLPYQPLHYLSVGVVGCCNGLSCLYNSTSNTIFLFNPSTMTHQNISKIPKFKSPKGHYIRSYYINGFGYDAVNDDYKIVGMTTIHDRHDNFFLFRYYVVNIYSLKLDSWRRIKQVIRDKIIDDQTTSGTFVRSALHWIAESVDDDDDDDDDYRIKIIAFDIETDEYREVAKPMCTIPIDSYPRVDVLGGNLCFLINYGDSKCHLDMWVMKEYGVESSWTMLLSFKYLSYEKYEWNRLRPLVYSKCGKKVLLVKGDSAIFWYDLEKKVKSPDLKFQPEIRFLKSYVCLDSLIPLKNSIRTRSSTTTGKRKVKD